MKSSFYVLGMPLDERKPTPRWVAEVLEKSTLIIGESPKIVSRVLAKLTLKPDVQIFYLDNLSVRDKSELTKQLKNYANKGVCVSLFSDMGMPILFDPGNEVLQSAHSLEYTIRCVPGPTSWGTACALSGWSPPFLIVGFLSPKVEERQKQLRQYASGTGHLVLMDTPYRFQALLKDCIQILGAERHTFLAWEIGSSSEFYFWGTLKDLEREAERRSLKKGEFILLIQEAGVK
ncbi:MAG: hypothetical protein EB078_03420 [Proteobacteria bacterium]|nr:hypothetical protein [Pseudomonadota bacterium]NDD03932.1 hypothetical protein [Pseudomonadota bacterium]